MSGMIAHYLSKIEKKWVEPALFSDLIKVYSLKLIDWTFPANYNTFSKANQNVTMVFKIDRPYNPNENSVDNSLASAIFEALYLTTSNLIFSIEDGFYNPSQLATTLTNKFNEAVSNKILSYFETQKTNPSSSNPSSDC